MSSFTEPLIVELVGNNEWRVYKEFTYIREPYPDGPKIIVPAGFNTDFASVPRIFWIFISPVDRHGKAAVLHDYMYRTEMFPRHICDYIFKEAMTSINVAGWKKFLIYWNVRIFGFFVWLKRKLTTKTDWKL